MKDKETQKGCGKVQVICKCKEYKHWCGDRCSCGHVNSCPACSLRPTRSGDGK